MRAWNFHVTGLLIIKTIKDELFVDDNAHFLELNNARFTFSFFARIAYAFF